MASKKAVNNALPRNVEAERSVLGLLLSGGADPDDVLDRLTQGDFFEKPCADIFKVCCDLYEQGQTPDFITVSDHIDDTNFLAKLNDLILPGNIQAHIASIKDAALRRSLIQAGYSILECAGDKALQTREALDKAQHLISSVADIQSTGNEAVSAWTLTKDIFDDIDLLRNNPNALAGIPTGFHAVDRMLEGLQPTNLIILAARPRVGKTTLAGSILLNQSVKHNIPVGMFSLEMSKKQIVQRSLSAMSGVGFSNIRAGRLNDDEYEQLGQAAMRLKDAPFLIDDTPDLSILELRSRARKLKRLHDIKVLFVDYLTKVGTGRRRETRDQEVTDIATALKSLARELEIPIVCLAQLNRECEKRTNKRPILSDLRESGGIEQEADEVLFLHRDELYNQREDNPQKGIAEVIIAKQRNGREGIAKLAFIGERMTFSDLALQPDEEH